MDTGDVKALGTLYSRIKSLLFQNKLFHHNNTQKFPHADKPLGPSWAGLTTSGRPIEELHGDPHPTLPARQDSDFVEETI